MGALRERLQWGPRAGEIHDGPRLYLMMRPDVLMGALHRVDGATRAAMLQAMSASTHDNGIDSLRAYAQSLGGNGDALVAATVAAASDLGWGEWQVRSDEGNLVLEVRNSPFVAGWRLATTTAGTTPVSEGPVCAPIRGMFTALAGLVLKRPVKVMECRCAANETGEGGACLLTSAPGPTGF